MAELVMIEPELMAPTYAAKAHAAVKRFQERQAIETGVSEQIKAAGLAAESELEVYDINAPVPDDLPEPHPFRMWVMPVGIRSRTKIGNFIVPEDTIEEQFWNHPVCKIAAMGRCCFQGHRFRDIGFTPDMWPKVGDLLIFNPRTPRRVTYGGIKFIIMNDEEYQARILPHQVEKLKEYI